MCDMILAPQDMTDRMANTEALGETETVTANMSKGITLEVTYDDYQGNSQTIVIAKNKVIPNQDSIEYSKLEDLAA